jgi:hypothetical protein
MITKRTGHFLAQKLIALAAALGVEVNSSTVRDHIDGYTPETTDLTAYRVTRFLAQVVRTNVRLPENMRDAALDGVEYFSVLATSPAEEQSVPWLTDDETLVAMVSRGTSEGWMITFAGQPLRHHRDVLRPIILTKFLGTLELAGKAAVSLHGMLEQLTADQVNRAVNSNASSASLEQVSP